MLMTFDMKSSAMRHFLNLKHAKRVNDQVFIWKSALETNQEINEADQHSCGVIDGTYKVHWIDNQTTPDKVLELVVCDCKKGKCSEQYQCVLLQVSCTTVQIFANSKTHVNEFNSHSEPTLYSHSNLIVYTVPHFISAYAFASSHVYFN